MRNPILYLIQFFVFLYFLIFILYIRRKYSKIYDIFVTSAVLEKSNQLSLIFNIPKFPKFEERDLFIIDGDVDIHLALERSGISEKYSEIQLWTGPVPLNDTLLVTSEHKTSKLVEGFYGRPALKIQPIRAYSESHEIVTCASIIDTNKPMNNTITAIITSISMGSFVNLPYDELPLEIWNYFRNFENQGKLRLDSSPLTRYSIQRDKVKSNLAQLHCMLMYRSSSQFLIFQDIDQIMAPLLNHPTYLDEFSMFPDFSFLQYNARITPESKVRITPTRTFILKTPFDLHSQITPMYTKSLNETKINLRNIATEPIGDCDNSWKCESKKCVGAEVIHRSLHAMYSYNIHQTRFNSVQSYDCKK